MLPDLASPAPLGHRASQNALSVSARRWVATGNLPTMDEPVEHALSFPPVGPQPNKLINVKVRYKSSLLLSLCYGSGFELSD